MTTTTEYRTLAEFASAEFPWTIDIHWSGPSGVHVIDDDRRVEIHPWDRGTMDHYNALHVDLVSKTAGKLTSETFDFADFLPITEVTPESAAHHNVHTVKRFHAWRTSGGVGWYIAVPSHPERLSEAIERWIDLYR